MSPGYTGVFVIPWAQTEIDGVSAPEQAAAIAGAAWHWRGQALRLDGPQTLLRLSGSEPVARLHRHARRRLGTAATQTLEPDPMLTRNFMVTDGRSSYVLALIDAGAQPLLVCHEGLPPEGTEMWIVRQTLELPRPAALDAQMTGICHTSWIATPNGAVQAGRLRPDDLVLTKDEGAQPLRWVGSQTVSQARLMLSPGLRPNRIHSADPEPLYTAPGQSILVSDPAAQALFNASDVLISASRCGPPQTRITAPLRYTQLLLDRHSILFANGIEVGSFHPADLPLASLAPVDRSWLAAAYPHLAEDPFSYGPYARRRLSAPEVSLLRAA